MMLVDTYVAPSVIEGVGVFAAERIVAGTLIWRLDTTFDRLVPRSSLSDAPEYLRLYLERYTYPMPDDPETLILEFDNGRFMNHDGENPNTDLSGMTEGFARRDIAAGEELTCDYNEFDPEFRLLPSFVQGPRKNGRRSHVRF
jgi:hypothetical protein